MKDETSDLDNLKDKPTTPPRTVTSLPAAREDKTDEVPILFSYSRQQAIDDGVLVDLTPWAAETGFVIPVACTAAVWQGYVMPAASLADSGQSERGRAHDLLWMLYCAIKRMPAGQDMGRLAFDVLFFMPPGVQKTVQIVAVCGPGDAGEPVLTLMLPDEN